MMKRGRRERICDENSCKHDFQTQRSRSGSLQVNRRAPIFLRPTWKITDQLYVQTLRPRRAPVPHNSGYNTFILTLCDVCYFMS